MAVQSSSALSSSAAAATATATATVRKPTRLRAACNECHAAKLKCSGERNGCRRCVENGLECVYEVSMVGRAPKGRGRKRRKITGGDSTVDVSADVGGNADGNAGESADGDGDASGDAEGYSSKYMYHGTAKLPKTRSASDAVAPAKGRLPNDVKNGRAADDEWNGMDNNGRNGMEHDDSNEMDHRHTINADPSTTQHHPLLHDLSSTSHTHIHSTTSHDLDACACDSVFSRTAIAPADGMLDLASLDLPADYDISMDMPLFDELLCDASALPSTHTTVDKPLIHSTVSNAPHCAISMIDPPPERPNCTDPHHDKFRHALHMVRVVAKLESKTGEPRLGLDDVLQFNKACLRTIMMIFELENRKFCKTCKALAPTALDLVMTLYEKAVQDAESAPPAPRLGCFELERDDHAVLRDLIVQRELQRTVQTVQTLCEWSRCMEHGQQCGTLRWYNAIEERLTKLMPSVRLSS